MLKLHTESSSRLSSCDRSSGSFAISVDSVSCNRTHTPMVRTRRAHAVHTSCTCAYLSLHRRRWRALATTAGRCRWALLRGAAAAEHHPAARTGETCDGRRGWEPAGRGARLMVATAVVRLTLRARHTGSAQTVGFGRVKRRGSAENSEFPRAFALSARLPIRFFLMHLSRNTNGLRRALQK